MVTRKTVALDGNALQIYELPCTQMQTSLEGCQFRSSKSTAISRRAVGEIAGC